MRSERQAAWFEDILENIVLIERFAAGLDYDAFRANEQVTYAVLHALLIISEAARRLGVEAERLAPNLPCRAIRALGNVLRHEYGGIDRAEIWRIVTEDLSLLKRAAEQALTVLRAGGSSETP